MNQRQPARREGESMTAFLRRLHRMFDEAAPAHMSLGARIEALKGLGIGVPGTGSKTSGQTNDGGAAGGAGTRTRQAPGQHQGAAGGPRQAGGVRTGRGPAGGSASGRKPAGSGSGNASKRTVAERIWSALFGD